MSVSGPKPMPTKLRVLRGETRPSRLNRHEPAPRPKRPTAPKDLSPEAKRIWRATCAELEAMGLAQKAYEAVIYVFVVAVEQHRKAAALLSAGGLLIRGERGGGLVKNPAGTQLVQFGSQIIKCAAELGLTPSALSRIQRPDAADDEIARRYFS